jgi:glycosyltransferase involved in cell wall biosynthesis
VRCRLSAGPRLMHRLPSTAAQWTPRDSQAHLVRVLASGAQGPSAPGFRIRMQLPSAQLRRHGVAIEPLLLFTDEEARAFATSGVAARTRILLGARRRLKRRISTAGSGCTTAFVQRQVDMLPTRQLERLIAKGRRLVLDIDDAVWFDTAPEAGGHPLAFLKDSRRKVAWLAQRSDAVLAGNDILAEWLSTHSSRVRVVPSLVDPRAVAVREHTDARTVVWGWIGSRSTAVHLRALSDVLGRAARELPDRDVEVLVVGGPAPEVPGARVRELAWTQAVESDALGRIDIGLMPLPDTPWTRGKCSYKALQYMNAGIPVVADDVGVSAQVIADGEGGIIARGRDDWVDALVRLSRDASLRRSLGEGGRRRVVAGFSVERWAPEIAAALRG